MKHFETSGNAELLQQAILRRDVAQNTIKNCDDPERVDAAMFDVMAEDLRIAALLREEKSREARIDLSKWTARSRMAGNGGQAR